MYIYIYNVVPGTQLEVTSDHLYRRGYTCVTVVLVLSFL